ncbi:alpha/beta fold hydrolase [Mycoplasma sp. P36-A1]|uniref:alpha/beta fold hydrolase n=1 Tax=Mycoplasma sp. P36-A1 TaxID=3252900 RepID=UPI003C30CE34
MKNIQIKNRDNETITINNWHISDARAVLIIAHGASEHINRYEELAKFLNNGKVEVYGYNHKGHGPERKHKDKIVIAESNGDEKLVNDLEDVCLYAYSHNSKLPLYVLGHSMGSLITRVLMMETKISFNGVILTGTLNPSSNLIRSAKAIGLVNKKIFGSKKISPKLNKLVFGDLKERISYNSDNINEYILDEDSGIPFSNSAIDDLLKLTVKAIDENNIANMQKSNYLFMSGKDDAFSDNTKQLYELVDIMDKYNINNEYHFYHGMKHEILNEEDNIEVYVDILNFIKETSGHN